MVRLSMISISQQTPTQLWRKVFHYIQDIMDILHQLTSIELEAPVL